MRNEQLDWYKDAIIYEVHVRGFFDSTGDGNGDLRGLIEKIGYLADLGVNCLWLMPIFASPLKDDGYDISDFHQIHPTLGDVNDFEALARAAHALGIRIITDLVLNHTSDQHPWFQEARRDPNSPYRNYYVWNDTDQKYLGTRVIFNDTYSSNWTWDTVARQYYWHRFFSHQPDLNFDNPAVRTSILDVIAFWLDRGIDGFRVDAIPYLYEREGTSCENLPETHAFCREIRRMIDERYPGAVLLAEANQWPADLVSYFGQGDEFHMAFNFPLMPRIFMAIRREQARPIVDIMEQLPPIPEACQWALFLRNHDELALEMVTDEERDYMVREYAKDPRMRLNMGIRRRLAPLVDADRRQIVLLHSLLFTLPGAPVLYYGDEIAMGDNIFLGDRNGVRTPMHWSGDRNAGFSRADPSRLYAPLIQDPLYHYQAVNVEAQLRSPMSLLNVLRRLIRTRKKHPEFARGSLRFLDNDNPRVVAYLREYEGQAAVVVNNLSASAQPVHLNLGEFRGRALVELLGNQTFPAIDDRPYFLSLSPHSFFWFGIAPGGGGLRSHGLRRRGFAMRYIAFCGGLRRNARARRSGGRIDGFRAATVARIRPSPVPGRGRLLRVYPDGGSPLGNHVGGEGGADRKRNATRRMTASRSAPQLLKRIVLSFAEVCGVSLRPQTNESRRPTRRIPIGAELIRPNEAHFRVWAPQANKSVEVILEGDGTATLAAEEKGYFSGTAPAKAGTRYAFRIDGGKPLPDPASRFQPQGPHGPSEIVDPSTFAWTDSSWKGIRAEGVVLYEMHIGTFTPDGTWKAAAECLSDLAELGVTVLEVMPVADFPGRFGWGYDGVNFFAPTRIYGVPDDFRAFVDRAHGLGLGVVLDVVYNHFGPDGNYLKAFATDYFTDRYKNEWGEAINFDGPHAEPVREFVLANAGYWIDEFHLDGLRLDATQQIFDTSADHIVRAIARKVREAAKGRSSYLVAENEPQRSDLVRPESEGGYGLDALWNDDFHHSAAVALTGKNPAYYSDYKGEPQELISAMKWGFLYQGQRYSWQRKPRGTPCLDLAPSRFVTFLQNHDQVANSGTGLPFAALVSPGRLRAMTALLLLGPATPMLFQGQEFGSSRPFHYFADHKVELAQSVASGRKDFLSQFPELALPAAQASIPDPADPNTFAMSKLDSDERRRNHRVVALHRDLLTLRRTDPAFRRPRLRGFDGAVISDRAFLLRFFPEGHDDRLLVVNLGRDLNWASIPEPLLAPPIGKRWSLLWTSDDIRYGGSGTAPPDHDDGWLIPGEAAIVLGPSGFAAPNAAGDHVGRRIMPS